MTTQATAGAMSRLWPLLAWAWIALVPAAYMVQFRPILSLLMARLWPG
ncbi:MAG: hypothetical protein HY055_00195 [Magnetospirillum sp.]|nr:hypothetical protein [Magnetospirillum sp.]